MAPPDTIWHNESVKLKEIFGTREGFEICPNQFFHRLIKAPPPPGTDLAKNTTFVVLGPCMQIACKYLYGCHSFTHVLAVFATFWYPICSEMCLAARGGLFLSPSSKNGFRC